jgi:hypothetical protein
MFFLGDTGFLGFYFTNIQRDSLTKKLVRCGYGALTENSFIVFKFF